MRLEIANVSFRLEEASPSLKTCIGLAMKQLSLRVVPEEGSPDDEKYFFDRNDKKNAGKPLHKQLSVTGLCLYIEAGQDIVLLREGDPSKAQLEEAMVLLD